jgi:hypothetical protein
MDLRKDLGGALEKALNKLLDDNLKQVGKEWLKAELHKMVDSLIDKHYDGLLGGAYEKLKVIVDKIDGEVDVQVPAPAPAPAEPAEQIPAPGAP